MNPMHKIIKHPRMRKIVSYLVVILLTASSLGLYLFLQQKSSDLPRINEVAFSAENGVDWIEIFNPTLNNLSLEGLYLTDDPDNYTKFEITNELIVPSRGYALIYGNGYTGETSTTSTVANFRISNGETIYLISSNGQTILDSLTAITSDEEMTNFSVGRFPDGADDVYVMPTSTPARRNMKGSGSPMDMPSLPRPGMMRGGFAGGMPTDQINQTE